MYWKRWKEYGIGGCNMGGVDGEGCDVEGVIGCVWMGRDVM